MIEKDRKGWNKIKAPFGPEWTHAKGTVFRRLDGKRYGIHLRGEKYGSMESYPSLVSAQAEVEAA